jgi:hypothetical protein
MSSYRQHTLRGVGAPRSRTAVLREPKWPKRIALCAAGALGLFGAFLLSQFPPSPDDAVYDYIGWRIVEGGTVYVDASDQNWPGMMFLHALSTALFGNGLSSWRSFDALLLLPAGTLLLALYAKHVFSWTAATWLVATYPIFYVCQSAWMVGQRDVVATPLLVAAALLQLRRSPRASAGGLLAQGALIGACTLLRPTLLAQFGVLALIDLVAHRHQALRVIRHQTTVFVGVLLPLLAALAIGYSSGSSAQWWADSIVYNVQVYGAHGSGGASRFEIAFSEAVWGIGYWHFLFVLAAVGAVRLWRKSPVAVWLTLSPAITGYISYLAQGKGFGYHLGPWLPVLALFACGGLAWASDAARLWRTPGRDRVLAGAAALVLVMWAGGMAKKVSTFHGETLTRLMGADVPSVFERMSAGESNFQLSDASDLARWLRETTATNDTVLVWGRPMMPNFLSERRSPTRYSSFAMLDEPREGFGLYDVWEQEISAALDENRPAVICLFDDGAPDTYRYLPPPGDERRLSDLVYRLVKTSYREQARFGGAVCFRRTASSEPG